MKFIKTITITEFSFFTIEKEQLQRKEFQLYGWHNLERARAKIKKEFGYKQCLEPKIKTYQKTYEFDTDKAKEIKNNDQDAQSKPRTRQKRTVQNDNQQSNPENVRSGR